MSLELPFWMRERTLKPLAESAVATRNGFSGSMDGTKQGPVVSRERLEIPPSKVGQVPYRTIPQLEGGWVTVNACGDVPMTVWMKENPE